MRLMFIGLIFLNFSCASHDDTRASVLNITNSLGEIKKLALFATGAIKYKIQSSNGRELQTDYYSRFKDNYDFDPEKSPERIYSVIYIDGDRRPYDVYIEVIKENKIQGIYKKVGTDVGLAKKQAQILEKKLIESLGNRNAIDDFKAF